MASILIIEDSSYQRELIKRVLVKEGFSVLEANNGKEGLEQVENNSPDIIILDLNMPEISGWELLEKLQPKKNNRSIIVFSADIQESSQKKCVEQGVKAFLNKPLYSEELIETINNLLKEQ